MVDTQKNPPEFYQARDDVDGGMLPKRSMRTLRKHCAALKMRQPWEDDPKCSGAVMRKAEWLGKIEQEIERRKHERRSRIFSVSEMVLAGSLVLLVGWVSAQVYSSCRSGPTALQTAPSLPQPSTNRPSAPVVTDLGDQLSKKAVVAPLVPAPSVPRPPSATAPVALSGQLARPSSTASRQAIGLVWQPHVQEMNWNRADEYCNALRDDQRRWRLPTLSELQGYFPAKSSKYVINRNDPSVWSSTIPERINEDALLLNIVSGQSHHRNKTNGGYVLCVAEDYEGGKVR
jgi:hypothetical protein